MCVYIYDVIYINRKRARERERERKKYYNEDHDDYDCEIYPILLYIKKKKEF